jgi:4-alpha-glucanotransferase
MGRRRAGVILHPTSLPGGGRCGDLGPEAYHFVDFLAASGLSVWQTLPLGPTHEDLSPYQCLSVHAGNPRLISIERLVEAGWLDEGALECNPDSLEEHGTACLQAAYNGFQRRATEEEREAYRRFQHEHSAWLEDYALYQAIRRDQDGRSWLDWPQSLRDRSPQALAGARRRLAACVEQVRFEQYLFFSQWHALRRYANERDVLLFGDLPIFVAHDSAEVWARRDNFAVDEHGQAQVVAGVPPDYFSATGQRWGNPHYRWDRMEADGFQWWIERVATQLALFDLVRIDHFRGFESYWEIDAGAETAMDGRWVKAPGQALFERLEQVFDPLPLVAEDLGIITPQVEALRRQFGLPGMKILQFAFDGNGANPYLPHHHEPCGVVYTGTHDNDTSLGWFDRLSREERERVRAYFGYATEAMPWLLIRAALASVAQLSILPMQDLLGLGSEHRMNTPGTQERNWVWRFHWGQVQPELAEQTRALLGQYDRLGSAV